MKCLSLLSKKQSWQLFATSPYFITSMKKIIKFSSPETHKNTQYIHSQSFVNLNTIDEGLKIKPSLILQAIMDVTIYYFHPNLALEFCQLFYRRW